MSDYKPFLYVNQGGTGEAANYTVQVKIPLPTGKAVKSVDTFSGENEDEVTVVLENALGSTGGLASWTGTFPNNPDKKVKVTVVDGKEVKGRSVSAYSDADDKEDN